jgi:hypothetical protein
MRNRGLKRPIPSEILLSGTVSEEEEVWLIPECHVTHWKVLKCPTTSKSGWQNLSWNYQKVNIITTFIHVHPKHSGGQCFQLTGALELFSLFAEGNTSVIHQAH